MRLLSLLLPYSETGNCTPNWVLILPIDAFFLSNSLLILSLIYWKHSALLLQNCLIFVVLFFAVLLLFTHIVALWCCHRELFTIILWVRLMVSRNYARNLFFSFFNLLFCYQMSTKYALLWRGIDYLMPATSNRSAVMASHIGRGRSLHGPIGCSVSE